MMLLKNHNTITTLRYKFSAKIHSGRTRDGNLQKQKFNNSNFSSLSRSSRVIFKPCAKIVSRDGFLFIEMMVALTLLATFGSSLFLVQTNVLEKLFKTHTTITKMFELDKQWLQFTQNMQFALSQKKPIESIQLHHTNKNPDYVVDIKMKNIAQSSKLFKNFGKYAALVQASITQDNRSDTWWSFAYIKTPDKKDKDEAKQSSTAKTTP